MSKKNSTFGNIEVKKSAFYESKYPIDINEIDIKQILISDKSSYDKKSSKYFNGHKDDDKIKLMCKILPKISRYINYFVETIYMSLLIVDEKLLKAYNKVWNKISNIMQK